METCTDCNHCETKYCHLPKGHIGECEVYACAETDDPKWWRHPIHWLRWKWIMRKIGTA